MRKRATINKEIKLIILPTEEEKQEVLKLVREGKNATEIASITKKDYRLILRWRNNVLDKDWRRAEMLYQLDKVELFSKRLMGINSTKKDTSLLGIQQKEAEFLRKHLIIAKDTYNDTPQVAVQVNLPSPIIDLGKLESE